MDDWFDGFNFSSGESSIAYTDSQNVDYGWGLLDPDEQYTPVTGLDGWPTSVNAELGEGGYAFGATPEVTTNDFGTVFDNIFGGKGYDTVVKGVGIAKQAQTVADVIKQANGGVGMSASSGANGAKSQQGVGDILATFGGFLKQVSAATGLNKTGTGAQATTAQRTTYTGQLTPAGGLTVGGVPTMYIILGGAAAIGLALYLHKKG